MTEEDTPMHQTPDDADNNKTPSIEEELKKCKDNSLRLLAEMENMRKRMQKEKQESTRFAVENVIADFLAPLDNLEIALSHTKNMSEEVRNWAMGFQMILSQFKDVLSEHGIAPFKSEGTQFDPHKHEAVETEETDQHKEGTVLQEFVRGYKSGERTIRPARVKVAKAKEQKKEENDDASPTSSHSKITPINKDKNEEKE